MCALVDAGTSRPALPGETETRKALERAKNELNAARRLWESDDDCGIIEGLNSFTAAAKTAIAAIDAALASDVQGWRTISSAPKDGTHFLAYETTGEMYRAAYHSEGYMVVFCGQPCVQPPEPEFWLPLDALPSRPSAAPPAPETRT